MERACLGLLTIAVSATVLFGGLFYPHTIAGAIARFVFSV